MRLKRWRRALILGTAMMFVPTMIGAWLGPDPRQPHICLYAIEAPGDPKCPRNTVYTFDGVTIDEGAERPTVVKTIIFKH